MLKTVPWLKGFGGMIVSEKDTDIMKLNVDELKQCLAKDKAIMLRGFDTNHEIFKKFTDQFSKKFLLHFSPHVRPNMGDDATITGVLIGNERVHLHGEMNYSPVRPEILFLHCTIPSAVGGETTLCDGRAFYLALPEELKKLFESKIKCVIDTDFYHCILPGISLVINITKM